MSIRECVREFIDGIGSVQLVYVDYQDELSDEQLQAYLADDFGTLVESLEPWISEAAFYGTEVYIREAVNDGELPDDLTPDEEEAVRTALYEADTSTPVDDLVHNTASQLLQFDGEDDKTYLVYTNDFTTLAAPQDGAAKRIRLTGQVNWARIDGLNGCGMSTYSADPIEDEGTDNEVVVSVSKGAPARLDSLQGYGSWDNICGLYMPAFGDVDIEVVSVEKVGAC